MLYLSPLCLHCLSVHQDVGACSKAQTAFCDSNSWRWVGIPDECHFHYMPPSEFSKAATGRRLTFMGDSVLRMAYYAAIRLVSSSACQPIPLSNHTHVFHYMPPSEFRKAASGKRVTFMGDSVLRMAYYAAIRSS